MKYLLLIFILFTCCTKEVSEPQSPLVGVWNMEEVHSFDPFSVSILVFNDCGMLVFNDNLTGSWIITETGLELNNQFTWSYDSVIHLQFTTENNYQVLYRDVDSIVIQQIISDTTNYLGIPFDQDPGLKLFLKKK